MEWIEGCKDQAMVGCSSWRKIMNSIEGDLAEKVKPQLNDISRRQILIELLGPNFTQKYIPNKPGDPFPASAATSALNSSKKKEKMMNDMRNWLKRKTNEVLQEKGLKDSNGQPKGELLSFMNESGDIISKDVHKQLQKGSITNKISRNNPYGEHFHNSDQVIGNAMVHFIEERPEIVADMTSSFKQYTVNFPQSLRPHLWRDYLIKKETHKKKGKANWKQIRDSFQRSLDVSMKESKTEHVTRSLIWKQIDKEIQEVFQKLPKSSKMNNDENITETVKVLNILHVYNKSYYSYYIYWANIIQQVYLQNDQLDKEDDLITTAMYLELILRHFAPKPNDALDIASKVWAQISEKDKKLHSHVTECMKKNMNVRMQDFSPEILKMGKIQQTSSDVDENNKDFTEEQKKFLEQPNIFICKWILEGFVCVLNPLATLFIWDQLFLNEWNHSSLQYACVILMGLLQPWFLNARDYNSVREVFCEEPSKLYTTDITRTWKHLSENGKFHDLPTMNRNVTFATKPITPEPENVLWLPHEEQATSTRYVPRATDAFDFYIDSVRLTSDNSSIIKVTGKFINLYLGDRSPKVPEILAYPELNSPARYPEFKYKLTVNREKQVLNPDALILLRVYTKERYTQEVVVLGSCLVGIFCTVSGKPIQLNVDGHQLRLHCGLPNPEVNANNLDETHMDNNPIVPCATILIRLLEHSKTDVPAPKYESRYYKSQSSTPNESEKRVYKHYLNDAEYKMTMKDLIMKLQRTSSTDDRSLMNSVQQQLSQKKGAEVPDLPFERFIKYDQKYGIKIVPDKAAGLPVYLEGRFFQCLFQIFPGQNAESHHDRIHSFLTQKQDLECVQRAPDWLDPPKVIKPVYDPNTVLLVSLYGIRPTYVPPDGDKEATLMHRGGGELTFTLQHAVAWGVVRCFDKGGVLSAVHHVPLYKGEAHKNIIDQFQTSPLEDVLQKNVKNIRLLETASMEVTIWDGRFSSEDCPPLPVIKSYLKVTPYPQKYIKAKSQRGGPPVQQLLQESLPYSILRDEKEFTKHKSKFESLIQAKFNSLMNKALTDEGYSPLE